MNLKAILLAIALVMTSLVSSANGTGKVEALDLKYLLQDCRDVSNEVRCLRQGIQRLVRQSELPPPSNLVCRSGSNGKFALYDNSRNRFLDDHYAKSSDECRRTTETSYMDLICAVGGNGKYAVRRISDAKFLSRNYSIDLNACMMSVQYSSESYICIAGSNGLFARYDMQRGTYLDSNYSMSIEDCLRLIP